MKGLDEILFGFLIFFAIDRLVRIFSLLVVVPYMEKQTTRENRIEGAKLFSEFLLLLIFIYITWKWRKPLAHLTA
jgi:hypothetical protein